MPLINGQSWWWRCDGAGKLRLGVEQGAVQYILTTHGYSNLT